MSIITNVTAGKFRVVGHSDGKVEVYEMGSGMTSPHNSVLEIALAFAKEIANQPATLAWIRCKKKMPEIGVLCLVIDEDEDSDSEVRYFGESGWEGGRQWKPTHWMDVTPINRLVKP